MSHQVCIYIASAILVQSSVTASQMTSDLLRGYPPHASCGGARPRVELVDEETREAVIRDEMEGRLKVLPSLCGEATYDVRGNGQVRYTVCGEGRERGGSEREREGGREGGRERWLGVSGERRRDFTAD